MVVIIKFDVPASAWELGTVLGVESEHSAAIELEALVPSGERPVPFFWIYAKDPEPIIDALRERQVVDAVEVIERMREATLIALEWDVESDDVFSAIAANEGHILRAVCQRDRWEFEIRFSRHEQLTAFRRYFEDHHINLHVQRIYHGTEAGENPHFGLTASQQEALALAVELGYYDIPRRCTTAELGERLGISPQAVTERLRRAIANLAKHTLLASSTVEPS